MDLSRNAEIGRPDRDNRPVRRQDQNSFGSNRPSVTAYSDASKKFDEMIDAAHVLSHGEGQPSNDRPIRERGGRNKEMEFEERK